MCPMVRKRNPIVDSVRRRGLHTPQEEAPPGGQGEMDMTSFRDAVMALSASQAAEAQLHQAGSAWGCPDLAADDASISSDSVSPDLGEMWRYGCPKSPDWDSEMAVCFVEEELGIV